MSKSTLVLITLAALGLGALIGFNLVDDEAAAAPESAPQPGARLATGGAPAFRYLSPGDVPAGWVAANPGQPFTVGENVVAREAAWKSETLTIDLAGDSRVEYKIFMAQGDAVVFNWSVDGEEVYFDFHAHDDAFGDEFFTRYEAGYGTRRSGAFVAPYAGQHGWYWQNLEPDHDTVTLEVAGFFDRIEKMDLDNN